MKRLVKLFFATMLCSLALASCVKPEEIENLQNQINEIKQENIASIESQIKAINSSITKLESTDKELKGYIETLQIQQAELSKTDADLESLIKSLQNKDVDLQNQITNLKSYVDDKLKFTQDADWALATFATIEMYNSLNGKLGELQTSIYSFDSQLLDLADTLQKSIDDAISDVNDKIKELSGRLDECENKIELILARIQSMTVLPSYSDGSVKIAKYSKTDIYFVVSPRSASLALASVELSAFSLKAVATETKSSMFIDIPVNKVADNGEVLVVTVDGSDLPGEFYAGTQSLSAMFKIEDGNNTRTSEFFALSPDALRPGPDYVENGVNLGASIAVLGDWNEDGNQTILYWAPVNCGYEEKGTVNSNSDHRLGKLYQWGAGDASLPYLYEGSPVVAREMYYDTPTPSPWYSINGTTSDKWNNNQGPCPEGWRLPTSQEFKVLCAGKNGTYGWTPTGTYAGQSNTYAGAEFFGANANKTAGKGVFFPAAGYRGGSAQDRGSRGYYWSSTTNVDNLNFSSTFLIPQHLTNRGHAQSVRCVSGEGDHKGEVHQPAVLTTAAVSDITVNSAVCGGIITSEGDGTVKKRGVCIATHQMPTVMDSKVVATGSGLGSFTFNLQGLFWNTTYYVRAYAINEYGTYYGDTQSFTTMTITTPDYIENGVNLGASIAVLGDWNEDGNQTILYWAPVNCGYEEKGTVNSNSDHRLGKFYQWGAGDASLPYVYEGSPVVAREMYYDTPTPSPWYGSTVIDGTTSDKWNNNQGPCPEGWRLPTSQEFKVLCAGKNGDYGWVVSGTYAGQSNTYAGAEFFGANSDKTAGKGVFFPAAGERRGDDGSVWYRGSDGYYWSSTPSPNYSNYAYYLFFSSSSRLGPQNHYYRAQTLSVRCVKE